MWVPPKVTAALICEKFCLYCCHGKWGYLEALKAALQLSNVGSLSLQHISQAAYVGIYCTPRLVNLHAVDGPFALPRGCKNIVLQALSSALALAGSDIA